MPMQPSAELTTLLQGFRGMQEAILQDKPVTQGMLQALDTEMAALPDPRRDPRFEETWTLLAGIEEKNGFLSDGRKLLCLNDRVAAPIVRSTMQRMSPNIELPSVEWLSDVQADALAAFRGTTIKLNGLRYTNARQIRAFAASSVYSFSFNGLTRMTDDVADAFGGFKNKSLDLDGLQTITDHQADALGQSGISYLNLKGLETITDAQMRGLMKFKGTLTMYGLRSITETQAKAIVGFDGEGLRLRYDILATPQALAALYPVRDKISDGDLEVKIEAAYRAIHS